MKVKSFGQYSGDNLEEFNDDLEAWCSLNSVVISTIQVFQEAVLLNEKLESDKGYRFLVWYEQIKKGKE